MGVITLDERLPLDVEVEKVPSGEPSWYGGSHQSMEEEWQAKT